MEHLEDLRQAARHLDAALIAPALGPEVEFRAPVLGRVVFVGPDDVLTFFRSAFSIFDEVVCRSELHDGDRAAVLVLDCRYGRLRFTDALLVELDEDGLVRALTPHLRPWPSSTLFILRVAVRLVRRPALLARSLRPRPVRATVENGGSGRPDV